MATAKGSTAVQVPTTSGPARPPGTGPGNLNTSPVTTGDGSLSDNLTGADRDAYLALTNLFDSYGLGTLAPKIYDYIKNGYSADTISILLQQTDEYKQRFAGNESRKTAGLPVLSPSEYLATEASYRQIMESAGLPSGFYDQPSDFTTWIGKNVSPTEIQSRVDLATQATTLSNPSYRQALNQMGISDNQLTAYFLDPTRALPTLQKSAATAAIGAEALQQGLTFDTQYAQQLATSGVSQSTAHQGYAEIADTLDKYKTLANIYGGSYDQRTAENAAFLGDAAAVQQQRKLVGREAANFGGAVGTGQLGLANPTQAR